METPYKQDFHIQNICETCRNQASKRRRMRQTPAHLETWNPSKFDLENSALYPREMEIIERIRWTER